MTSLTAYITLSSNGWIKDDLKFYVLFDIILRLPERMAGDDKRLCAIEPRPRLETYHPPAEFEPVTGRSEGQHLTYGDTMMPSN